MKQRRPTVLVVDDDTNIMTLLHHVLTQHGFVVWQASNGRDAVDLYR